jgi:hypothetical protein
MTDVARVLLATERGDADAAAQVLPLVYDELRKLAAARLARERPGQTPKATALVHNDPDDPPPPEKTRSWWKNGDLNFALEDRGRGRTASRSIRRQVADSISNDRARGAWPPGVESLDGPRCLVLPEVLSSRLSSIVGILRRQAFRPVSACGRGFSDSLLDCRCGTPHEPGPPPVRARSVEGAPRADRWTMGRASPANGAGI